MFFTRFHYRPFQVVVVAVAGSRVVAMAAVVAVTASVAGSPMVAVLAAAAVKDI